MNVNTLIGIMALLFVLSSIVEVYGIAAFNYKMFNYGLKVFNRKCKYPDDENGLNEMRNNKSILFRKIGDDWMFYNLHAKYIYCFKGIAHRTRDGYCVVAKINIGCYALSLLLMILAIVTAFKSHSNIALIVGIGILITVLIYYKRERQLFLNVLRGIFAEMDVAAMSSDGARKTR